MIKKVVGIISSWLCINVEYITIGDKKYNMKAYLKLTFNFNKYIKHKISKNNNGNLKIKFESIIFVILNK